MCLAIPMKIMKKKGNTAVVSLGGVERTIDVSLVKGIKIGDYVIVHAGFAIQKLNKKEARETLKLFDKMKYGTYRKIQKS
ncbi:MAG: HypC/HybG/HupF family hydrogenase formation chaperone [Candidatus Omnitrophica bacterium]|nr:HypC/HybG/HupF family hydrogenase formation chaperone [Candidatus Omnitrophota bacterium]